MQLVDGHQRLVAVPVRQASQRLLTVYGRRTVLFPLVLATAAAAALSVPKFQRIRFQKCSIVYSRINVPNTLYTHFLLAILFFVFFFFTWRRGRRFHILPRVEKKNLLDPITLYCLI